MYNHVCVWLNKYSVCGLVIRQSQCYVQLSRAYKEKRHATQATLRISKLQLLLFLDISRGRNALLLHTTGIYLYYASYTPLDIMTSHSPGIFRVNGFIPVSITWSGQGSLALTAESALLDAEMFGLVNESFFEKVPRLLISAERYSFVAEVLVNLERVQYVRHQKINVVEAFIIILHTSKLL